MDNGKHSPFISQASVRDALDNLIRVVPKQSPNSLVFLLLVDMYLTTQSYVPNTSYSHEHALNKTLTSLITQKYSGQRKALDLKENPVSITLQDSVNNIAEESQRTSIELLSWSILYHLYVRTDLSLSPQQLYNIIHINERTFRRYLQHGVKRLTESLIEEENKARQDQHKRQLYTQLPPTTFMPLIGRDNTLKKAEHLLRANSPRHIQITGPNGIGKTTFVGVLLKNQINSGLTDRLVWITQPQSIRHIRHYLHEQLIPEQSSISLREYTFIQDVTIVIDDFNNPPEEINSFQLLLSELSAAQVIIIGRIYNPLLHCSHIALNELSRDEINELVECYITEKDQLPQEQLSESIWNSVGGNPMGTILMIRHWPFHTIRLSTLDDLYSIPYFSLGANLKRAWLTFALFPPIAKTPDQIIEMWPTRIDQSTLEYLTTHHLLEVIKENDQIKCFLTTSYRRFIENRYQSDQEMQTFVVELLDEFQTGSSSNPSAAFDIIEYILLCDWLHLENTVRERWVTDHYREGLQRGHYSRWRSILEFYKHINTTDQAELQITYGTCLRHLSEWEQAQVIFEEVIHTTGRAGRFTEQAHAIIEWVTLLRHQGKYTHAIELLSRAENTLSHQPDERLLYTLHLEQIQIALDTGDISGAETTLANLPENPQTLMLWCDIHFLKENYESLGTLSNILEPLFQNNPLHLARTYTLLGQSHHQQNNLERAYSYFCLALTILEQHNDIYALARVRSNLGALMIQQGNYLDAQTLLIQAEHTQKHLHDQVGLSATRHNLHLLNRKVVR